MIKFDNSYSRLPQDFYELGKAASFPNVELLAFNHELSKDLGLTLEDCSTKELAVYFSGQKLFPGSANIALAYSGHQFGQLNPQLGDGRALLIGEVLSLTQERFDIQMKGSGPTSFSRGGDGKAALGPVIREYLMSEAMKALGIKTTRSLAAVATGEMIYRENPLPGAVVTRVAQGHIRFGTFEYFAIREDKVNLEKLFSYTLERHYPDLFNLEEEFEEKVFLFFHQLGLKVIDLVSDWMRIGFIHGVMNTDNMSIAGETIDYGPCAFMHKYNSDQFYSSIDKRGRYRYSQQLNIALWNLSVLAKCLLLLVSEDETSAIKRFEAQLTNLNNLAQQQLLEKMLNKIGIQTKAPSENEKKLLADYLKYLETSPYDYTTEFHKIIKFAEGKEVVPEKLDSWFVQLGKTWNQIDPLPLLRSSNPQRIPRNDLIELAITKAYEGDLSHFLNLQKIFAEPYVDLELPEAYRIENTKIPVNYKTFCGT